MVHYINQHNCNKGDNNVKIFISSTFKDMHAERDMLDLDVFPEIAEFLRDYGEELTFIDLRWGINTQTLEDNESTHKILTVCLDEIDNSKPYFIAFLGERYGWIPQAELIEKALKQRPGYSYIDNFEKSVTALEIEYGALSERGLIDHCLFYFREPFQNKELEQEYIDMYCSDGEDSIRRLEALKAKIVERGGIIRKYTADWDEEKNHVTGLEGVQQQVIDDLKNLIRKNYKKNEQVPWQQKEINGAEAFFSKMLNSFLARKDLYDKITDSIFSGSSKLLLIKGELGSGKSTMMANLIKNAQDRKAHVLPIICGHSKNTSKGLDIWRQIVFKLEILLGLPEHIGGEEFEYKPSGISVDWIKEIADLFYKCSQKLTDPIVIFIDGVDMLSSFIDFHDSFMRLLARMSKNIVFVLSCVDDFSIPAKLDEKIKCRIFTLDDLNTDDKKSILDKLESLDYQKDMVLEVKSKLLSMPQSNNPLYLSMMYQRMIMLDSDDFMEIIHLGDGLEGQKEYMLRMIDDAPGDIDGVCAMIMEEAASRINKELCDEVLRLIAVTRDGLRERDIKFLFRRRNEEYNKEYNMRDFYRLKKYMRQYFSERKDARINFVYENFRLGILKKLSDTQIKRLNEEVFTLLESLSDNDSFHRDEYAWFAWKCDKKSQFIKRIGSYTDKHSPARGLYDICMKDKGEWIISILKDYTEPVEIDWLLDIIRIDFCVYFNSSSEEMMVLGAIMEQALQSTEYIAKKYSTQDSIHNVRVLPYLIASTFEIRGMYDKALEYYMKTIDTYNTWGADLAGYELIYDKIGDLYKSCNKYDQALEYYRKAIEGYEEKVKKIWNYRGFLYLINSYEKAGEFCKMYGMHDEMMVFIKKASDIKELQERRSDDSGDNLLYKFEFTNIQFVSIMEDADEHKINGENDQALQCYEKAFKLLENEALKWNKTENLKCLGELYDRLAEESKSCGNKLIPLESSRRALKIKESITNESYDGDWYYDLETKWQKLKLDSQSDIS